MRPPPGCLTSADVETGRRRRVTLFRLAVQRPNLDKTLCGRQNRGVENWSHERFLGVLTEEIEASLDDLSDRPGEVEVEATASGQDIEAGGTIAVSATWRAGGARHFQLPANLAIGYLADEEAAVDEWRHWVHDVWSDLTGRG